MPRGANDTARRSVAFDSSIVDDEVANEDFAEELRTRRSIHAAENVPAVAREAAPPAPCSGHDGQSSAANFFECLKLAAENKINIKNAFGLKMIDFLAKQVREDNSAISKNFGLASCSLDAGTKIYAARVDCVAKDMTDFSMVMTMGEKKNGREAAGVEDEEAHTVEAKRKKIKKLKRAKIFATSYKELQLDLRKLPQTKESVFPLVGNLMNEAIDSFNFTDRGSNGTIPELMPSALEYTEPDTLMKIKIPRAGDLGICPTLEQFQFALDLSAEMIDMTASNSSIPEFSLHEFQPEALLEDTPPLPLDQTMEFSEDVVEEERVACNQQVDLVAERVEDARGGVPVALHGGRHLHLPGPAYWKYKKPKQPDWVKDQLGDKKKEDKKKDKPLDFSQKIDLSELQKSKKRVTLKRETLLKWSSDKITLPFTLWDDEPSVLEMVLDINKYLLMPSFTIPNIMQQEVTIQNFNVDPNEIVSQHSNSEDEDEEDNEHPVVPIEIESDDVETFSEDMRQMMSSLPVMACTITPIGFKEFELVPLPQIAETVLPEWKPSRRINMKKLEQKMWGQVQEAEEAGKPTPTLNQLYEALPKATQQAVSCTTAFFAMLNVSNREGVVLTSSSEQLEDCDVHVLPRRRRRRNSIHPALELEADD